MEGLRRKAHVVTQPVSYKGSDANVWREGYNQAIDKCLALAEAEAAVVGDWEQNYDLFASSIGLDGDQIDDMRTFTRTLLAAKDKEREEVIKDIITLADKLESECNNDELGDKGTYQWRAFKGFRNTIRDRYLPK